jgi:molybdate transport system substrate-binding protein
MPPRRPAALGTTLLLLGATGFGCAGDPAGAGAGDTTLVVFAAASLTTSFTEIGRAFEEANDGVEVELSFGGSSDLVAQIQEGAPADVFASADQANMDRLTAEEMQAGEPQPFASNRLEIATPPDNPAGIASFADLVEAGVKVVVCAPEVPCGAAAVQAQEAAGVTLDPVSEESSVTDVLGKVTSGEADAGLVYVTDVAAAGDAVTGVPFPESGAVVNTYPIVALEDSEQADLAAEFVELVLSDTGQSILEQAGFGRP